MLTAPLADPHTPRALAAWGIALATAVAYGAVGLTALLLAGPPGYASPHFPPAGIALAAVLVYGTPALPGVLLGAVGVNASLGLLRGQPGWALLALPICISLGATLQAWVGARLLHRFVGTPLVLNAPHDVLRSGFWGALVACVVSPSVATTALVVQGVLAPDQWAANWLTWWLGDVLGVLIAMPLVLIAIGQPRSDWWSRRLTVGLPLLLASGLLVAALVELRRSDDLRARAAFERDGERLAFIAQTRLAVPLHALHALHGVARLRNGIDADALRLASQWWLAQPIQLQAMGYSVRVRVDELPAFEARVRAEGVASYRVFDRDGGAARARDGEVVALRHIEPLAGNASALGVNPMSIPAAREAILKTRASADPAASEGFLLTQSKGNETGVVIYQALYAGEPASPSQRDAQFRAVVFVTVSTARAMAGLAASGQEYLHWCLIDPAPGVARRVLAGASDCESAARDAMPLRKLHELNLAGRPLQLLVRAQPAAVPGGQPEAVWLLSTVGLVSVAMLGALLLTVTGHARRTEREVQTATAELRHEVAERRQAEIALRDSEGRLRGILDNVPLGVAFIDTQGVMLECNPKLGAMIGCAASELRGRPMAEFIDGTALTAGHGAAARSDGEAGAVLTAIASTPLRCVDGSTMQVRLISSALRDEQGRVLRTVAVLEDVTEHLRLQAAERSLHRAQAASQAKSEFLSRMSHELRTPLNAMIGFAQLMGMSAPQALDAQQREWTQQIQQAGWHLLEMINETLDLARIESGAVKLKRESLALPPLLQACSSLVATMAAQRGVRIDCELPDGLPAVMGDALRLKQVLTNLLSNAVKYNRDGGRVSVVARRVNLGASDGVEIAITDTGMGMTVEQLAALFQPYNRLGREHSNIEGTGIGLAISQRLSELMGGSLHASSVAGEGSVFTLRLPAAAAAVAAPEPERDASAAFYAQRLVHYVEDNETNIEIMRAVLAQRPQIRLEHSALGESGLAAIAATQPDLVLLDVRLPDISGLEVLRRLKQDDALAAIPVMMVSADASARQAQDALTSGALHYETKPLDIARFLHRVDDILNSVDTKWG